MKKLVMSLFFYLFFLGNIAGMERLEIEKQVWVNKIEKTEKALFDLTGWMGPEPAAIVECLDTLIMEIEASCKQSDEALFCFKQTALYFICVRLMFSFMLIPNEKYFFDILKIKIGYSDLKEAFWKTECSKVSPVKISVEESETFVAAIRAVCIRVLQLHKKTEKDFFKSHCD